ncbi:MAG: hypothetical protein JOZ10_17210 [Acidobacteria bacterium]|nr:hypothetical protein [Acidobacteriota bacterium]MBV9435871.1 hypothetical protein [Acidobacteriota bacterium]
MQQPQAMRCSTGQDLKRSFFVCISLKKGLLHPSALLNSLMSDDLALKAIEEAVGPAPWYWKTFKSITGNSGNKFAWRLADYGKGRQYVFLENEQGDLKFAAHTHTRAVPWSPGLLAAWFPVLSETPPQVVCEMRIVCFDPDKLPTITGPKQSSGRTYYSAGRAPIAEFSIAVGLAPGANPVNIPREFHSEEEVLIVASPGLNATTAIYAVYPKRGKVIVFPQLWFKGFDEGYQWISRVTRHPSTRRFVGDGVRIGKFELTDEGCHLARWIVW